MGQPSREGTARPLAQIARTFAGRLFEGLVVVWLLATLVFFAMRLLPGDPAALVLGDQATEADLAALRSRLGLDAPIHVQYAHFLRGLATLDLGESLRRPGTTAAARVGLALGPTAALAGVAVVLGAMLGVGGAILGAGPWLGRRRAWVDRVATALAATPLLALAPVVTFVLVIRLRVIPLPGDPEAGAAGLLFASALLSLPLAAQVARIGRAALAEVAKAQYLTVAKAKGGSDGRVYWLHALPAASGPILTVVGTQLGALLGGAVVLERLFDRPGLGTLILDAYASRDLPVLQAAVIASGALFVLAQQVASASHAAIDPRARGAKGAA